MLFLQENVPPTSGLIMIDVWFVWFIARSVYYLLDQVSGVVRGICKKSNFDKKNRFFMAYVAPGVPAMGSLKKYIHTYKYIYMSEELYHIDYMI